MTKKRIETAAAVVLILMLIAGCGWFQPSDDSGGTRSADEHAVSYGSLEIHVSPGPATQTIRPSLDMIIDSYELTLSGPGDTVTRTLETGSSSAAFGDLEPGDWTVTVNAFNAEDPPVIIATGETTVTVTAQQTATVGITVTPLDGEGTLDIALEWPDGALTSPTIEATMTSEAGTEHSIPSAQFPIDTSGAPDRATYTAPWDAGYYTLSLSLRDEGVQVWGNVVAVRIIAGETSIGQYTLEASAISQTGQVEVNIGADLLNPYTITLSGQQPQLGATEDMTVTASLDPPDAPDSYEWYLDGELQDNIDGNSITLGPSGLWLDEGRPYRLSVVVKRGVTISSESIWFTVEEQGGPGPGDPPVDPVTPDDPDYTSQWHYVTVGMPDAWGFLFDVDYASSFSGAVVAVIDTGYLPHPDLAANITGDGYDFISDPANAADGDGIDADPTDPGDDPEAPSWHGTHVGGTIAAVTDNTEGVSGIGWDQLQVMPIRVLGLYGGSTYDIIQAIYYAAGEPNDSGTAPTNTVSVINMSLGSGGYSQGMYDAIQAAVDNGITVVCAAGNYGTSPILFPAHYDNTIGVSALWHADETTLAPYSSFGPMVEFAAPGYALTTSGTDGYGGASGTSMAAPHVAGVAALLYAFSSDMDQGAVRATLADTSVDLGVTGRDDSYGYGLIQADAALTLLATSGVDGLHVPQAQTDAPPTSAEIHARIQNEMDERSDYSPDRIIVKLKSPERGAMSTQQSQDAAADIAAEHSLEEVYGSHPVLKSARLSVGQTVEQVVTDLLENPEVEYAEPIYYREPVW